MQVKQRDDRDSVDDLLKLISFAAISANGTEVVIRCDDQEAKNKILEILSKLVWPTIAS